MRKIGLSLIAISMLATTAAHADGLFHMGASAALGVATKSVEKAVEIGSERRANAETDPVRAAEIRLKAKAGLGLLQKTDEKLFSEAGINMAPVNEYLNSRKSSSSDNQNADEPVDIEVGIYGDMSGSQSGGRLITIPSQHWLAANNYNASNAVGIRIPANASFKESGSTGTPLKVALVGDIKNLRDTFLAAGAAPELVKQNIERVVKISNIVYGRELKKQSHR